MSNLDIKPTFLENVDMMLNDALSYTKIDKEQKKRGPNWTPILLFDFY